jgi:hypothetical protein
LLLCPIPKRLININEHLFKILESVEARGPSEMRGDEHIAKAEKWIVRVAGLIVKSIQAKTA